MKIEMNNITQKYGDFIAVDDVSLTIKEGEMVALLGPSGCGKTTLLRTIAGLIPLNSGTIFFDGTDVSNWSAQKRNTALVFQSYALFPHMTVAENVAYGLKVKGIAKTIRKERLQKILSRVKMKEYGYRKIYELSGGQQQRVALARALVVEPGVLLFDEPLSNLDEKLRVTMRQEIRKIQLEYGITSVYVTHDQEEAMSIADRIVIMDEGVIQQIGTPREIYFKPHNTFVAGFMGTANIVDPEAISNENGKLSVQILGRRYSINTPEKNLLPQAGTKIMFRPEDIHISPGGELQGTVKWYENLGAVSKIAIECQNTEIIAQTFNRYGKSRDYNPGEELTFSINADAMHIVVD